MIQRLQDYDYYFGPYIGFEAIEPKKLVENEYIYDKFMDIIVLKNNEKIFTSPELAYQPHFLYYAIRGVLQTKLPDGTIKEQDIEYVFNNKYIDKVNELNTTVYFKN